MFNFSSTFFFCLLFFSSAIFSICCFFCLLFFPSANFSLCFYFRLLFCFVCYFTVCYFFICLFSVCYFFHLPFFPSAIYFLCFYIRLPFFQELIRIIRHAEILIARNVSLKSKFTQDLLEHADAQQELEHFISSILQNSEVAVRGGPMGPAGSVISKLFHAAQRVRKFSTFFFTQGFFVFLGGGWGMKNSWITALMRMQN